MGNGISVNLPDKGKVRVPAYNPEWRMSQREVAEYQQLFGELQDAKARLELEMYSYSGLSAKINDRELSLAGAYEDVLEDAERKVNPRSKRFPTLSRFLNDSKGMESIERAVYNNIPVQLNNEELIRLGGGYENIERMRPAVTDPTVEVFEVTKKDGTKGYVKIKTSSVMPFKKTEYQKLMASKQDAAEKMIAENVAKYAEVKEAVARYPETFVASDKGLVRSAGLTRDNRGKIRDLEYHMSQYSREMEQMKADKKLLEAYKLEASVPPRGIKYTHKIESIMWRYGVGTPKEAHELLKSRISLVKQYEQGLQALEIELETIQNADPVLKGLKEEVDIIRKTSPEGRRFTAITKKITGKFKEFMHIPKVGKVLTAIAGIFAGGTAVAAAANA